MSVALLPSFVSRGATAGPPGWPQCKVPVPFAAHELRQKLLVKVCGEQKVIPGRDYPYTVLLTNAGERTYRGLELTVTHYERLTGASRPYRRGDRAISPWESIWTVDQLRPAQTFRLGIRLPFLRHNDPKGSNFMVSVRARGQKNGTGLLTKDVYFK